MLTLDKAGVLTAAVVASIIVYFGGAESWRYLLLLIAFLVAGAFVTNIQVERKKYWGLYEGERSVSNVLANGLVPVLTCVFAVYEPAWRFGFICSVAAITADKFSSELGTLSAEPVFLLNMKKVARGSSGAVSTVGMMSAVLGSFLVGLCAMLIFGISFERALLATAIGVFGSFIDSIVGVFETFGFGNKATTNIICSATGALAGYYLTAFIY